MTFVVVADVFVSYCAASDARFDGIVLGNPLSSIVTLLVVAERMLCGPNFQGNCFQ